MIEFDVEQGTPEWHAVRAGIPSASNFDKIYTATGKKSTQATQYSWALVAQRNGIVPPGYESLAMKHGKETEAEARNWYGFARDVTPREIGFVFADEGYGCSPDALIGDDGGIEVKCPDPTQHVQYVAAWELPTKYKPQVQGSLLVTGREWWDFVSYCPSYTPLVFRVERDEKYIAGLRAALDEFLVMLENHDKQYKARVGV